MKRASVATIFMGALFLSASFSAHAALTINVQDPAGNPVEGFRWLIERDTTHRVVPGEHVIPTGDPEVDNLSISIHHSHAPVVVSGEATGSSVTVSTLSDGLTPLPDERYAVSILPFTGYSISGANIAEGQTEVDVTVVPNPVASAQVRIKVFHDTLPLNNNPDIGEPGLEGFSVLLFDNGGQVTQDICGNPLGTTYLIVDGSPVPDGEGCFEVDVLTDPGFAILTDANGEAAIKYLPPNKYGIEIVPPTTDPVTGEAVTWYQTTTIEGKKTIDAWVRPNEPPFLIEFGPPFWHAFYGFVQPMESADTGFTISGTVRKGHQSRPPLITFSPGAPAANCLVGVNRIEAGAAEAVAVVRCGDQGEDDGGFTIDNLPPGTYQLVIWDVFLDQIISFSTAVVEDTDLGDIVLPVPMWFAEHDHWVFFDANEDGIWQQNDPAEFGFGPMMLPGIPEQNVNLRFRDGSIYQAFPTDGTGFVPFEEIFPFFKFLVAEIDFARFKATGVSIVTDEGGDGSDIPPPDAYPYDGKRLPQDQTTSPFDDNPADPLSRTEVGPALLEAFQTFAGQNTRFDWGKKFYNPADVDNAPVGWCRTKGAEDIDQNADGVCGVNDVDNEPLGWCDPAEPMGPEDVDFNGDGDCDIGENGGISGVAIYATTRAEDDPEYAAGEEWEPGIPRIQVNLYKDANNDGVPDCRVQASCDEQALDPTSWRRADVDNYPFNWAPRHSGEPGWTGTPGPEDVDWNGNGNFQRGDALRWVNSDSWDDSLPEGCIIPDPLVIHGVEVPTECPEGLRTWNQTVPGVFDGGWAFGEPGGQQPLVPGRYIVEAATPPGYELLKEEDRNVDFGDAPIPSPLLLPPECVGDLHTVPDYMSFQTDAAGTPLPGIDPADLIEAPFAGLERELCDRKRISLTTGKNAAVDFFMFTQVPRAARVVGQITDDFANELAPGKPTFVEKYAPGWIPVSIQDPSGNEIIRTYGDEFGQYNALLPSTYTVNLPTPTGVGPTMHRVCLNHPGPILNDVGVEVIDPRHDPRYSVTCYSFDFWPGKTTYLDTPVVRTAAFVGALQQTLDCEFPHRTPVIDWVRGRHDGANIRGPFIDDVRDPGNYFTLKSLRANEQVRNPAYPGVDGDGFPADPPTEPQFITRNYNFGPEFFNGNRVQVSVGPGCPTAAPSPDCYVFADADVVHQNARTLRVTPSAASDAINTAPLETGQLIVTTARGVSTPVGITLTVGLEPGTEIHTVGFRAANDFATIQTAISSPAVEDGDLILVEPGIYTELVIMDKKVRLQGSGAGSTTIDAIHFPGEETIQPWRDLLAQIVEDGACDPDDDGLTNGNPACPLLPGQRTDFRAQEGPGVMVLSRPGQFANPAFGVHARIDGFSITGADLGGAIFANAWAENLQVSNNRLINNAGTYGGGVRVGTPLDAIFAGAEQEIGDDSFNDNVTVHHNHVNQNGSSATGGGVAVYNGTDGYAVTDNYVCGNFSRRGGGGMSHLGNSDGGAVERNVFLFNEVFQGDQVLGGVGGGGGGLEVRGEGAPLGAPAGTLSQGTGTVTVNANLFQGNLAGADDGGAIRAAYVNGADVEASPGTPASWYELRVFNNFLVNNVSGLAGGGMSLQDVARARILHNTLAHNDSTATGANAFDPAALLAESTPQVAGLVSRAHSPGLAALTGQTFSEPLQLRKNIFWQNRSFFWEAAANGGMGGLLPRTAGLFWDLGVQGTLLGENFDPRSSVITELSGYHTSNIADDPLLADPYFNDLLTAAAADEGGNFVQVYYTPLTPTGDYHLTAGSPAIDSAGTAGLAGFPRLESDFDGEPRPDPINEPTQTDRGADETQGLPGGMGGGGNSPPQAVNDSYSFTELGDLVVAAPGVLANDSDPDAGQTLAAILVSDVTDGSLALAADGSFVYTPPEKGVGTFSFSYVAQDDDPSPLFSNVAQVDITREIWIDKVIYKTEKMEWNVQGLSSAPGSFITIHVGGEFGTVVASVVVEGNGRFRFKEKNWPVGPGLATTISLTSSTGEKLLNVPIDFD